MAFKAKFSVAGKEYNLLSCSYHLYQETDPTGRPSSVTRGGSVTVTVESTDDTSLFAWMCDSFAHKDGNLKFFKRDSESAILKQLDFEDAYCVSFDESFSHETSIPMVITLTLSAKKIAIGGDNHTNEWPI
jgi:hypothetical protein